MHDDDSMAQFGVRRRQERHVMQVMKRKSEVRVLKSEKLLQTVCNEHQEFVFLRTTYVVQKSYGFVAF